MKKSFWIVTLMLAASVAAWAQMSPAEAAQKEQAHREQAAEAERAQQAELARHQAPAQPQDRWMLVAQNSDGKAYVDTESAQYGPGYSSASLWMKVVFNDGDYALYSFEIQRYPRRSRVGAMHMYSAAGVEQQTLPPEGWKEIVPGSPEETAYRELIEKPIAQAQAQQQQMLQGQQQIQQEQERRREMRRRWNYLGCLGSGITNAGAVPFATALNGAVNQCNALYPRP